MSSIMNQTIGDFAKENFPDTKPGKIIVPTTKALTTLEKVEMRNKARLDAEEAALKKELNDNWDKSFAIAAEYNNRLLELDSDYTNLKPLHDIIVRCYHLVPDVIKVGDTSIYTNLPYIPMPEMTQNGMGIRKTYTSPWLYSTTAVVVALPLASAGYNSPIKVGDIVQLHQAVVMPEKRGVDIEAQLIRSYTHPSYKDFTPPTSPEDKHFGYLKVSIGEILVLIESKSDMKALTDTVNDTVNDN